MFEFTKYPSNFYYDKTHGFVLYFFFKHRNTKSIFIDNKKITTLSRDNPFTSVPEWGRKI